MVEIFSSCSQNTATHSSKLPFAAAYLGPKLYVSKPQLPCKCQGKQQRGPGAAKTIALTKGNEGVCRCLYKQNLLQVPLNGDSNHVNACGYRCLAGMNVIYFIAVLVCAFLIFLSPRQWDFCPEAHPQKGPQCFSLICKIVKGHLFLLCHTRRKQV